MARTKPQKVLHGSMAWIMFSILAVWSLFPFFVMISTSLKIPAEVFTSPARFIPSRVAWRNYLDIWKAGTFPFYRYLLNSLIVSLASLACNSIVAVPAAYALSRFRFYGDRVLLMFSLITQMFSPVIIIIPLFRMMRDFGLLNAYPGLILANTVFTLTFSIWLMYGYFRTIPADLEYAAMIDGCSRIQAMFRVALPVAAPGIATTGIYTFITVWNEFIFGLTFMTRDDMRPATVGLYQFVSQNWVDWHLLMAASMVCVVPVTILFLVINRHLVSGMTAGAIKS